MSKYEFDQFLNGQVLFPPEVKHSEPSFEMNSTDLDLINSIDVTSKL